MKLTVKLGQHGSLGCARRWGSCIRQMPPLPALVDHSKSIHPTAELETSEIVSPAAAVHKCSPAGRTTDSRLTTTPSYQETQSSMPSYHTMCKPRSS